VRIAYANDCHVDVVAYLVLADGRQVIVNRDIDDWEDTNPQGFTNWMRSKDTITEGNLRRVLRLLKFLRDHKVAGWASSSRLASSPCTRAHSASSSAWSRPRTVTYSPTRN